MLVVLCLRPSLRTTFYFVTYSLNLCFPSEDQLATQPEEYLFIPSAFSVSILVFFLKVLMFKEVVAYSFFPRYLIFGGALLPVNTFTYMKT